MNWLQTCPRKYQLSKIDMWVSKEFQVPLVFGILFHSAMENYHRAKAAGEDHEEATLTTLRYCLTAGQELSQSDDNTRTKFTLVRSVLWYLDQFKDDPIETVILENGKAAVELSFRVALPITNPDGTEYLWCGHIDRLGYTHEDYLVTDYKTTKGSLGDSFTAKFSPNNQVSGYIFGATSILPREPLKKVMIDGVELKVGFNRYLRTFADRKPEQIEEWVEHTMYWIKMAERFVEDDFWPMNLESCDKFGGCVFRGICSKSPSMRPQWLKGSFKQKNWNPLESREA
ncbi:MAG: PD-(D/E)XK nuclease family protein [Acidimicrobiia bacterium]